MSWEQEVLTLWRQLTPDQKEIMLVQIRAVAEPAGREPTEGLAGCWRDAVSDWE
jgi:hypothetical protein